MKKKKKRKKKKRKKKKRKKKRRKKKKEENEQDKYKEKENNNRYFFKWRKLQLWWVYEYWMLLSNVESYHVRISANIWKKGIAMGYEGGQWWGGKGEEK